MLEWYIDIANEMNLSLQNITLFPMAVDHGSLTVHTSVCNMWYSYIDRLKAESNKGKKKKWVNPISARCLSIIHNLVTNYLNDGKNVGSHASRPRKRARKNPLSLLPKSVFIELSINGSSEEMQSSTLSIKQVPEFGRCRYNENGKVIVNLQSIFDGAYANVKVKTISKQVVNVHQRKIKLWEARGTCFFRGYQMDIVTGYTPTNPSCNITLKDNSTLYYKKTSAIVAWGIQPSLAGLYCGVSGLRDKPHWQDFPSNQSVIKALVKCKTKQSHLSTFSTSRGPTSFRESCYP
jgi:hypothetical protein